MRLYIYFLSLISVGHTGIGDSQGVIHDFAGPYHINIGSLAFGRTTRYLQLSPDHCHLQDWDMGVKEGCEIYKGRNHNLILDNCHSHVAKCLNTMGYSKFNRTIFSLSVVFSLYMNAFCICTNFIQTGTQLTIWSRLQFGCFSSGSSSVLGHSLKPTHLLPLLSQSLLCSQEY